MSSAAGMGPLCGDCAVTWPRYSTSGGPHDQASSLVVHERWGAVEFRVATQPAASEDWGDRRWLQWLIDDGRLLTIANVGAHRCQFCYGPVGPDFPRCYPCNREVRPHLAGLFCTSYSTRDGLEPLIWGLKDNEQRWLARPLGSLLNTVLERHWKHLAAAFGPVDMLVPVPSHPTVRSGYDHVRSIVVPYHDSEWARGRLALDVLVRTRADRDGRMIDPTLFAVPDVALVAGQRIALLDDTFTRGATLASAAAALQAAGAAAVIGVTIGRQLNLGYTLTPALHSAQRTEPFDFEVCALEQSSGP